MEVLPENFATISDIAEAKALLLSKFNTPHIEKACLIAEEAHAGQFRKSGEPYIIHPYLVATAVAVFGGDESMVIAAILHDAVEDTPFTLEEAESIFNADVAHLVDGLTKIDKIREENLISSDKVNEKLIQSAMTFRKMLVASIKDIRVLVIKLCDRLHNVLTLDALREDKRRRIAEETLVVYAPIAHRLGIGRIKNILEDKSFFYIFPEDYAKIEAYIRGHDQSLRLGLNNFIDELTRLFLQNGFVDKSFEISARVKHHYSIYSKMQRKGVGIDEVLDLLALRVMVNTPEECYKILGILHTTYKPLIARFKDYIALPKENGYQTLHTTLFHKNGIFEVQIRTHDMHKTAEYGIAAHWKYKACAISPKLSWLEAMQYSNENPLDFYELAKNDLFSEEVVVYAPNGKTFTLPVGSTALDFAFTVHSEVGLKAKAAHINRVRKPLLQELRTGDMVLIEVGDEKRLRCSWLEALKTSRAKNILRSECNNRQKELDTLSAESMIAFCLNEQVARILPWLKEQGYEEILFKVPRENLLLEEIVVRYQKEVQKKMLVNFRPAPLKSYLIDNLQILSPKPVSDVVFDHCCHPKFGDSILLFYDSGGKTVIHHKQCENAYQLLKEGKGVLKASWVGTKAGLFRVVVNLQNRKGALLELVSFLSKKDVNIASVSLGQSGKNLPSWCEIVAEFRLQQLDKVRAGIEKQFTLVEFAPADDSYKNKNG